ncbi:branched-chain amino acid ABC transporter ATP-binding protein/permease [Effusibacillus dendaii]|uniref:Metal-dependent hydrolase n=1 Tax=Effusibacillus dendaii TaxID=2743772 RepID=A0A7I8D5S4_9BACL|nr:branched-chain amino acid ABC transporter ATP-binding protein/permease [Effusibacillus dendaii]BCJ85484.1 metal-dependent hydrolase [Effusibacillus dendaii]
MKRTKSLWLLLLVVVACFAPWMLGNGPQIDYFVTLMILAVSYAIACLGLTVVSGFAGQISLAQAAFYGVGAYSFAILLVLHHVPYWISVVFAILLTLVSGLLLGLISLNIRSHYLALVTIGFGIILNLVFHNWTDLTKGADGIGGIQRPWLGVLLDNDKFYLSFALVVLLLTGFFIAKLKRSRWGRALLALRENELAAEVVGVDTYRMKLVAFTFSAVAGGIAGIVYASGARYISPDMFTFEKSVLFFAMTLIGGSSSVTGTVAGAFLLTFLPEWLRFLNGMYLVIYGLAIILVLIFVPGGLSGIAENLAHFLRKKNRRSNTIPIGDVEREQQKDVPGWLLQADKKMFTGSTADSLLKVSDLVLHFGGVKAVDGVSLQVLQGDVHCVIGPNGSGKSTLLNLISGIYKPQSGQILFAGQSIGGKKPSHIARLGMTRTFQNIRLFPEMTVLENVMVGLHTRTSASMLQIGFGLPNAAKEERAMRERAIEILDFVGFAESNQLAKNLSYGQQRMVEIARALVSNPIILMLDEPAAGMNEEETRKLVHLLKRLNQTGLTIVLIEHDMAMVSSMASQITVLDFGKQIASGLPDAILSDERVIKAYLGEDFEYASS